MDKKYAKAYTEVIEILKHIPKEEIVCITFTNMAVENLKKKIREEINDNIECYTFHKLAMKILDETNYTYEIVPPFVILKCH